MTHAADDFDALFDEVSAQRESTAVAAAPAAPAGPAASADDDLEALFDQVSAGRVVTPTVAAVPCLPAGARARRAAAGHCLGRARQTPARPDRAADADAAGRHR